MTDNAIDILVSARELIANPQNWTKNTFARADLVSADTVSVLDPRASCYCMLGAILRVTQVKCLEFSPSNKELARKFAKENHPALAAVDALISKLSGTDLNFRSIISFNDAPETRHEDVLELFDTAIAELGSQRESP